jgi:hypothetical protein
LVGGSGIEVVKRREVAAIQIMPTGARPCNRSSVLCVGVEETGIAVESEAKAASKGGRK